jgi:hypothetical protein
MKTVEISGMTVTITTTPSYIQQIFWGKTKIEVYTILNRTFQNFPSMPVLMDSKGEIMSPLSNAAQLVKNEANLIKYSK